MTPKASDLAARLAATAAGARPSPPPAQASRPASEPAPSDRQSSQVQPGPSYCPEWSPSRNQPAHVLEIRGLLCDLGHEFAGDGFTGNSGLPWATGHALGE